LRLEDQRILRDPAPPPQPPAAPRGRAIVPAPVPDLIHLLAGGGERVRRPAAEARARRRAALALGHVGLSEGVAPLVAALGDAEPEVRQMAAFALGLIGDKAARDPLMSALADASPLVRARAAAAVGLLGQPDRQRN